MLGYFVGIIAFKTRITAGRPAAQVNPVYVDQITVGNAHVQPGYGRLLGQIKTATAEQEKMIRFGLSFTPDPFTRAIPDLDQGLAIQVTYHPGCFPAFVRILHSVILNLPHLLQYYLELAENLSTR